MSQSVILYIALSLDGYIATADGSVEWLSPFEAEDEDYGYAPFFDSIDGLVMGRVTYEQVLGFGDWVYGEKPCWVCTGRSLEPPQPNITITNQSPAQLVQTIQQQGVQRLWLVGGGQLVTGFREAGLISEFILSWMPVLLGKGIPLFSGEERMETLQLIKSQVFDSGVIQTHYVHPAAID
ncbi:MAG: dihydrofolate reductase family protein [Cyanobacteria bacterium J06638_20]